VLNPGAARSRTFSRTAHAAPLISLVNRRAAAHHVGETVTPDDTALT